MIIMILFNLIITMNILLCIYSIIIKWEVIHTIYLSLWSSLNLLQCIVKLNWGVTSSIYSLDLILPSRNSEIDQMYVYMPTHTPHSSTLAVVQLVIVKYVHTHTILIIQTKYTHTHAHTHMCA